MPSLASYRMQYPQYNDMSDLVLAGKLYGKFYSDMPKADFEKKINVPAGTIDKYERYAGTLGTAAAAGRGLTASVLGAPGDAISTVPGVSAVQAVVSDLTGHQASLGTPLMERLLPKKELGELHPTAQKVGELLPVAMSLALEGIPSAASSIGRSLSGARAMAGISNVGTVSDPSALGSRMMESLRPTYGDMYAQRGRALEEAAPSHAYVGASPESQAAMNAARVKVYNDPRFSDLKTFEESPLGKEIVRKSSRYSTTPKLDPALLPRKAFSSKESLNQLRTLLSNKFDDPQTAIEDYASEYVATNLDAVTRGKNVEQAAKAAEAWTYKNRSWLNRDEVPMTKAAADHAVKQLQAVAKRRTVTKEILRPFGRAAHWIGMGALLGAGYSAAHAIKEHFVP